MSVFDGSSGSARVPQGGTFTANPVSMVAGRVAMEALTPAAFDRLEALGDRLRSGIASVAEKHGSAFSVSGAASLFRIHARRNLPRDYREAFASPAEVGSMKSLSRFFWSEGIILPVGGAACLSTAMTQADIDKIITAFERFAVRQPTAGQEVRP